VVSVSGKPVFDAQGKFTGYRGIGRNITQRKRTKRSLREVAERFRSLHRAVLGLVLGDGRRLCASPTSPRGIRKVRGIGPETLIGKRRWEADRVGGDDDMARHRATLEAHLPFRDFVLARTNADGRVTYVSTPGVLFSTTREYSAGYRGVARDITARMRAEEELARMAHYDVLTGLPNRALLQGRPETRDGARRPQPDAAGGDVHRPRPVQGNQRQPGPLRWRRGAEGDRRCAWRAACARPTRWRAIGGDEFTVLLEDVRNAEEISRIADKLLRSISERAEVGGQELHLSTSIGVTVYPLDDHDADTLLRNADLAMYHAKQEGRNQVQFFSPDMSERTEKRVDMLGRLRGAVARKELELYYQPQVGRALGLGDRRRGAAALERPRARRHRAGGVHPARRGQRA
jgi:GGDEF domain-containing protein